MQQRFQAVFTVLTGENNRFIPIEHFANREISFSILECFSSGQLLIWCGPVKNMFDLVTNGPHVVTKKSYLPWKASPHQYFGRKAGFVGRVYWFQQSLLGWWLMGFRFSFIKLPWRHEGGIIIVHTGRVELWARKFRAQSILMEKLAVAIVVACSCGGKHDFR